MTIIKNITFIIIILLTIKLNFSVCNQNDNFINEDKSKNNEYYNKNMNETKLNCQYGQCGNFCMYPGWTCCYGGQPCNFQNAVCCYVDKISWCCQPKTKCSNPGACY